MYMCSGVFLSHFLLYMCIGMDHLVTMDLYHKEIQGFFDFPVDNLRGSPFLIQYITSHVSV